jgi:hypothetical protein
MHRLTSAYSTRYQAKESSHSSLRLWYVGLTSAWRLLALQSLRRFRQRCLGPPEHCAEFPNYLLLLSSYLGDNLHIHHHRLGFQVVAESGICGATSLIHLRIRTCYLLTRWTSCCSLSYSEIDGFEHKISAVEFPRGPSRMRCRKNLEVRRHSSVRCLGGQLPVLRSL